MEIYKDLSNPVTQEFEKLLNSQLSKIEISIGLCLSNSSIDIRLWPILSIFGHIGHIWSCEVGPRAKKYFGAQYV